ncbi:hypothetical protein Cs7R123_39940 [Catellatospora sp. TT07R-123]|nr:hypothetical protein Cs7R123_39940 [Catellatospora sp. TT07R-123]
MTTSSTNDTAKENFITDHGSIRLMLSRALRGPREADAPALERAARTASVTRTAPALALLTTDRRVDEPAAARPVAAPGRSAPVAGSPSGTGMPAGRVYVAAPLLPAWSWAGVGSD